MPKSDDDRPYRETYRYSPSPDGSGGAAMVMDDAGAWVSYGDHRNALGLPLLRSDTPSEAFMAWVHQGPALAKAAGLYVGIKIYASEQAAREAGDIE